MKRVICAVLAVSICSITHAKYSGGSGEPNAPYQIANVADLMALANDVNDYNKCFIMIADINLDPCLPGNPVFTTAVIARGTVDITGYGFVGSAFSGDFDGAGHKILNLTIDVNVNSNDFVGLFGDVNGGDIKNLGLENVKIISSGNFSSFCGGLAGRLENGSIEYCYSTGNISAGNFPWQIGGLVGENTGTATISNSHSTCSVTDTSDSSELGVLAGRNLGVIIDCFSSGTVTSGNFSYDFGGLVGYNGSSGSITDSYTKSNVIGGDYSWNLGGLAGSNSGVINGCFSKGSVTGGVESYAIGGIAGTMQGGSISKCYSTSDIYGGQDLVYGARHLGGLVGFVDMFGGDISNCYSIGNVTGAVNVGGLVGETFSGAISNCYSAGEVNGTYNVGGFLGSQSDGTISYSFFLITAGPDNGYAQPLTDGEMKQTINFLLAGWDLITVWSICEGVSYPKLIQLFIAGDFDNDIDVDFTDFALMGQKWRQADSTLYCGGTDLTGDEWVDLDDLDALLENWLDAQ